MPQKNQMQRRSPNLTSKVAGILLVALSALFPMLANAGSTISDTKITLLGLDKNHPDVLFIRTAKSPLEQDRVGCHTNNDWNYTLKMSSEFDKKIFSAMLAAQNSKQTLTLVGSGNCDGGYNRIEALNIVYIISP